MSLDLRRRRRPVNVARGNAYAQLELEGRILAPRSLCLLQHDQNIANADGASVRSDLNNALGSLFSLSSGATAPATTVAYQLWADTTSNLLKQRNAANLGWLVRGTLAETFVVARSSNTILAGADFGKSFIATSTFTQTLTAAATLGDGWACYYRNNGTGVITIDPNAAETIDGGTTLKLNPREGCVIVCNGTSFHTVGLGLDRGRLDFADNLSFTCSVNANALTIALKTRNGDDPSAANPVRVPFRNVTAATGDFAELFVTAASSIVISSGSALGTANSVAFRLWIVGFNDGGTFRLGVINCLSTAAGGGAGRDVTAIYPLGGFGIASSTAEGGAGAADSAQTFYTGSAVASKAYTVLGYVTYEAGLAAAGAYASVPTRVQIFGPGVPLPGQVIQSALSQDSAVASGAVTTPIWDDSIPQSSEGIQVMTQAITPSSAANVLAIDHLGQYSETNLDNVTCGLFQDAVANALVAMALRLTDPDQAYAITLKHRMLAATTSATTFKVRAGATVGTLTFNGSNTARKLGGVTGSILEVTELMG